MSTADWIEEALERRQRKARERITRRLQSARRDHAVWRRDMARVALVASLVVLGMLGVEMTRLAVHLIG